MALPHSTPNYIYLFAADNLNFCLQKFRERKSQIVQRGFHYAIMGMFSALFAALLLLFKRKKDEEEQPVQPALATQKHKKRLQPDLRLQPFCNITLAVIPPRENLPD